MFKYCHSCGGEFQSWVETCPECHESLHPAPAEVRESEAVARTGAPLEDLVLVKLGEPWELRALAASFQDRGISSQIDTYPLGAAISGSRAGSRGQPARLGIYVPRADLDAVREFAAEFATTDLATGGEAEIEHDPDACPACGEPTPANSASCSSCGLEFPEVEPDAGR